MARILLVEDEETIRRLWKQVLVEAGHMVITAVDGYDGLRMSTCLKGQIDLLVTDNTMPGAIGADMLAAMIVADCLPTQVLMVSGDFHGDGVSAALVRGLRALVSGQAPFYMVFLAKPCKIDQFLEAVDNALTGPVE